MVTCKSASISFFPSFFPSSFSLLRSRVQRRFDSTTTVASVANYITSLGYSSKTHDILLPVTKLAEREEGERGEDDREEEQGGEQQRNTQPNKRAGAGIQQANPLFVLLLILSFCFSFLLLLFLIFDKGPTSHRISQRIAVTKRCKSFRLSCCQISENHNPIFTLLLLLSFFLLRFQCHRFVATCSMSWPSEARGPSSRPTVPEPS